MQVVYFYRPRNYNRCQRKIDYAILKHNLYINFQRIIDICLTLSPRLTEQPDRPASSLYAKDPPLEGSPYHDVNLNWPLRVNICERRYMKVIAS